MQSIFQFREVKGMNGRSRLSALPSRPSAHGRRNPLSGCLTDFVCERYTFPSLVNPHPPQLPKPFNREYSGRAKHHRK